MRTRDLKKITVGTVLRTAYGTGLAVVLRQNNHSGTLGVVCIDVNTAGEVFTSKIEVSAHGGGWHRGWRILS